MYNVLFIDLENSVRSILAEALLNHWGKDKFTAYSAGSEPSGEINPHVIQLLEKAQLPTEGLHSKSVSEFSKDESPKMDFVFILCDKVRGEVCPIWPEHTITAVWGIDSPYSDDLHMDVIREILHSLESRINVFVQLPISKLEHLKLQEEIHNLSQ
ncbi:arsenate reductase ArsC [Thiomicrorhabdus sp.]|uniref:arsenate reductase ArsC n=1 Tax=Thiomicrorhabdus sp. TaxID=2039724 RepID=UPI002AA60316|nr:arsenate reductase ArsC [Thiomicrorhabdus sp.]